MSKTSANQTAGPQGSAVAAGPYANAPVTTSASRAGAPAGPSLAQRVRRAAHDTVLRSPLLRWRFGVRPGERFLLVPQDLRTVDASFVTELESGCIGLAGNVLNYEGGSPFALRAPGTAWQEALHGFVWLRHMRAAGVEEARALAENWVLAWQREQRAERGVAWQGHVAGRRLISLLTNTGFLLEQAGTPFHEAVLKIANTDLRFLARSYATAEDGVPRLLMLTAIIYGGLCIADQERFVADFTEPLCDELDRQILADGSPLTRETTAAVEQVMDLLPLRRCFIARNMEPPERLALALKRMIPFIAFMRLGDGGLARFNGVGGTWPDRVAAALAYRDMQIDQLRDAPASGYVRMERGATVVLMDAGVPPPLALSTRAHAGCLSFEMSSGISPMVVNCGAPGPADTDWRALSRGTAAHSTLILNEASSSVLVMDRPVGVMGRSGPATHPDTAPIEEPERVDRTIHELEDGSTEVMAWHDGYAARHGLRHERRLKIRARGDVLEGTDKLVEVAGLFAGRAQEMLPFAVRFHLHPRTRVRRGEDGKTIEVRLTNDEIWEFSALDIVPGLEESVFLAELSGPLQALQIVLRDSTVGEAEVSWRWRKLETTEARRDGVRQSLRVVDDAGRDDAPGDADNAGTDDGEKS